MDELYDEAAANYAITRGPRAWSVQLKRSGSIHFKSFSFNTCGGEGPALARARAWRDEMIKKHPPVERREKAQKIRVDNASGVSGVTCRRLHTGEPYIWVAKTLVAPGKIVAKAFSVSKWGEEAKMKAIEERGKQLRKMKGREVVHPAELVLRKARKVALPPDLPAPVSGRELPRVNSRSGVSGVTLRQTSCEHPGSWIATTYLGDGKYLRKAFAVRDHGADRSLSLAIAERRRQLKEVARSRRD